MVTPMFSIITVVFNDKDHIEETILSVIDQNFTDYEYIIIDGGSTDGTLELISIYKDKIDFIISEKDSGIYDAMNKGINVANGSWINFLNSGDFFTNCNILENIAKYTTREFNFIYGDVLVKLKNEVKYLESKKFDLKNLLIWNTRLFCHQSTFTKREILDFFDTSYSLKSELNQYFELLNRDLCYKQIKIPIVNFRQGGIGEQKFLKNNFESLKVIYNRVGIKVLISVPIHLYSILITTWQNLLILLHLKTQEEH